MRICLTTGKQGFDTKHDAKRTQSSVRGKQAKDRSGHGGACCDVYQCRDCGFWHRTSVMYQKRKIKNEGRMKYREELANRKNPFLRGKRL